LRDSSSLVILLGLLARTMLACSMEALAEPAWMSEQDMRAELVGNQLGGYYSDLVTWTSTLHEGGDTNTARRDCRRVLAPGKFAGA
jgi:hypothetical protein